MASLLQVKGFDLLGVRMGAQISLHPELRAEMLEALQRLAAEGLQRR